MPIPDDLHIQEAATLERKAFAAMESGHLAFRQGKISAMELFLLADKWELAEEALRCLEKTAQSR